MNDYTVEVEVNRIAAAYRQRAQQRLHEHSIPEHMHEDVLDYIEYGKSTGSFLRLLLENNFVHAAPKADAANRSALYGWARFIHDTMPAIACGSRDAVEAWMGRGGLRGVVERRVEEKESA